MKIELGQKYNSGDPCCAPGESKDKTHYPSLYFTHDEPVDVPEEGTAVIKFRKIESSENTRDPDDPKYRCEIEVHSIDFKGGGKESVSPGESLKSALRKSMKIGQYEDE